MSKPSSLRQVSSLTLLNLLLLIVSPFILLKKLHRYARKRHFHELDWRRWFIPEVAAAPLDAKPGKRIVLVGPTYGELRIIEVVTRQLAKERPELNILWCLRDLATIDWVKRTYPDQAVVIWPFENVFPVWKWVRRVKPDAIVITEKFWLPNLLGVSRIAGAKTAVINARTNRRDRITDRLTYPYYKLVADSVDLFCFQSPKFLQRLEGLLADSTLTVVTGNIKLDLETAPLDAQRKLDIARWLNSLNGRPLLAAGSTGPDDEPFIFRAYEIVCKKMDCALLMAPRKPNRAQSCADLAQTLGYEVSMRSREPANPVATVYVLDTLGELSYVYQFADAAFIGGTVSSTGHNVMEPLTWGIPVSYGPLRGHFEALQVLCEQYGVGFRCHTPEELAAHWLRVLRDQGFREEVRCKSSLLLAEERGATEETVNALSLLISKEGCKN